MNILLCIAIRVHTRSLHLHVLAPGFPPPTGGGRAKLVGREGAGDPMGAGKMPGVGVGVGADVRAGLMRGSMGGVGVVLM